METWAILIASGKEEQVGDGIDAAFLPLHNRPLIGHSLLKFERSSVVKNVIVVVGREHMTQTLHTVKRLGCTKVHHIVAGRHNRPASLKAGMKYLPDKDVLVVVHQASRPAFDVDVLDKVVRVAKRYGCAVAAAKLPDVVKMSEEGTRASKLLERNKVWVSQTPIAFSRTLYDQAMQSPNRKTIRYNDDESAYIQALGSEVRLVESSPLNMKIRSPDDLQLLSTIMRPS